MIAGLLVGLGLFAVVVFLVIWSGIGEYGPPR